jgi:hypothetical protein
MAVWQSWWGLHNSVLNTRPAVMQQALKRLPDIPPSRITNVVFGVAGLAGLGWAGMHSIFSGGCRRAAAVPHPPPLPPPLIGEIRDSEPVGSEPAGGASIHHSRVYVRVCRAICGGAACVCTRAVEQCRDVCVAVRALSLCRVSVQCKVASAL